jgi:hypothetical protein
MQEAETKTAQSVAFTTHAAYRMRERSGSKVHVADARQILEEKKYVTLGRMKKTERNFNLFYSPEHDKYFVAIMTDAGTVITILKLHQYEKNNNEDVSIQNLQRAARVHQSVKDKQKKKKEPVEQAKPSVIHLWVGHWVDEWKVTKTAIKGIALADCGADINAVLENAKFLEHLRNAVAEKGIPENKVCSVTTKFGSRGESTLLYLDDGLERLLERI